LKNVIIKLVGSREISRRFGGRKVRTAESRVASEN